MKKKKNLYIYKFMYIQSCVCVCVCSEKGKLFFSSSFQNRREDFFFFLIYPVNEKETSKTRPCVDRLHCATHYFWHPENVTCGECVSRDMGVFFFSSTHLCRKKKKKKQETQALPFARLNMEPVKTRKKNPSEIFG